MDCTQLALFTVAPNFQHPAKYDPYWDEITKVAPEHDNNDERVTTETSSLLDTGVREQIPQALEVAPEHIDTSSVDVSHTTNYLLDTGVREQPPQSPQYFPNSCTSNQKPSQKQKVNQWVEVYWVKRAGKKHEYYRYCWMEQRQRKINRVHIGSVKSNIAINRHQEVLQLISTGKLPNEIIDYLKSEPKN